MLVHNKLQNLIDKDLVSLAQDQEQMIHTEYYKYVANHCLNKSHHLNANQGYMTENLRRSAISSLGQLKLYKDSGPAMFLETYQLWNSIPHHWRNILNRSRRLEHHLLPFYMQDHICIGFNKWSHIDKVTTKDIKIRIQKSTTTYKSNNELNEKFHTTLEEHFMPFKACFKMTNNVKLRNVQFKILHNAYPTLKHLYHWRIKQSPDCALCGIPETTVHAIWECAAAQATIANLRTIKEELNINSNITKETFIYGDKSPVLNTIYTLIKRKLILQREDKAIITTEQIKKLITDEINVEKYNSFKANRQEEFNKRWLSFITLTS